jgi:hypothetical protein
MNGMGPSRFQTAPIRFAQMDMDKIIEDLLRVRELIDEAIRAFERLAYEKASRVRPSGLVAPKATRRRKKLPHDSAE